MARGLVAFEKYLPIDLVRTLLGQDIESKPQARVATILFIDIERFTELAEKRDPQSIVTLLNEYFSAVTKPIERYRGIITQFQGDAILAVFNVPTDDPDHAVRAALEIQTIVSSRTFGDNVTMRNRTGISTGHVVAGSVGAENRLNYTVHGDAVNLAARLEALNKDYRTRILIAQSTAEMVGDAFPLEPIGEVHIRGKQSTVSVYRVSPAAGELATVESGSSLQQR